MCNICNMCVCVWIKRGREREYHAISKAYLFKNKYFIGINSLG